MKYNWRTSFLIKSSVLPMSLIQLNRRSKVEKRHRVWLEPSQTNSRVSLWFLFHFVSPQTQVVSFRKLSKKVEAINFFDLDEEGWKLEQLVPFHSWQRKPTIMDSCSNTITIFSLIKHFCYLHKSGMSKMLLFTRPRCLESWSIWE